MQAGDSFYLEVSVAEGSDGPNMPLAAIPFRILDRSMGVLAIHCLFVQKVRFGQVDCQRFSGKPPKGSWLFLPCNLAALHRLQQPFINRKLDQFFSGCLWQAAGENFFWTEFTVALFQ